MKNKPERPGFLSLFYESPAGFIIGFLMFIISVYIPKIILSSLEAGALALIISFLSPWSFLEVFTAILILEVILQSYTSRSLLIETAYNSIIGTVMSFKFHNLISKYKKSSDKQKKASPILSAGEHKYVVVELFPTYISHFKNPDQTFDFLVIDYEKGEVISDQERITEALTVYQIWRYLYFNPPAPGSDYGVAKRSFERNLKLMEATKKNIENNRERENIEDERGRELIKELDQQVLDQYEFRKEKIEKQIEILDNIYNDLMFPRLERFEEIRDDLYYCSKMSNEENTVWQERKDTWHELLHYYDLKITKFASPDYSNLSKRRFIFESIASFLTNQIAFLTSLFEVMYQRGKKESENYLRRINFVLNYHIGGIKAIEKNIELNNEYEDLADRIDEIIENPDLENVRNPIE
ncbi:MAG: hypothetical protein ABEJ03_06330 [Candidatus Nanohaloarchaea archaeon]